MSIINNNENRNQLYVSDFLDEETEETLFKFFSEFNDKISDIVINKNKKSFVNGVKNNATVLFKDPKSAYEAIKRLNLRKLNKKTIRVMWHDADNSSRYNSHNNLFIKNIPEKVSPREFYDFFLQFGEIVSAKLNEDENGKHFGYGYINYQNPESALKAVAMTHEKDVWKESKNLEVKIFLKKNERINEGNKNIYIKNIPNDFTDKDIYNLFEKYGVITWAKVIIDTSTNRKFAIVNFEQEESVQVAIDQTNGMKIGEVQLFVSFLMKKTDRMNYLNKNFNKLKYCNLHVRNIPYQIKENELYQNFVQFGEIKSVRIAKKTKEIIEKGNTINIEVPEGFGYVCFFNPESAKIAIEKMNGGYLKKHENWKYSLIVDYFIPKKERLQLINKNKQFYRGGFPTNPNSILNQPGIGGFNNFMQMPNFAPNFNFPNQIHPMYNPNSMPTSFVNVRPNFPQNMNPKFNNQINNPQQSKVNNIVNPVQLPKNDDQPDINYLNSLEDESAKKDYLGEFIFKKIENHQLALKQNFTIDNIGKITGMILGIDDLKEITEIARNPNLLNSRLKEAMELMEFNNN